MSQLLIALILTITAPAVSEEGDSIETAVIPEDTLNIQNVQQHRIQFDRDPQIQITEDAASYKMQTGSGTVEVTCEVKNTDFASQCRAAWAKSKKKDTKESNSDNSHNPRAEFSITWSSDE